MITTRNLSYPAGKVYLVEHMCVDHVPAPLQSLGLVDVHPTLQAFEYNGFSSLAVMVLLRLRMCILWSEIV